MIKKYRTIVLQCDKYMEDIIVPTYPVIRVGSRNKILPHHKETLVIQCYAFHNESNTDVVISCYEGLGRPTDFVIELFREGFIQSECTANIHRELPVPQELLLSECDIITVGVCHKCVTDKKVNEVMNKLFSLMLRYEEEL